MYIEKIRINKFRVLEDIPFSFQVPRGNSSDSKTGNVVNVVAGVNGTGKSSLLEGIFHVFKGQTGLSLGQNFFDSDQTIVNYDLGFEADAKVIWLDSRQNFEYEQKVKLPLGAFVKVDPDAVLGNAELYIKEFVVSNAMSSHSSIPSERMEFAINKFNKYFDGVNIYTRLSKLDSKQLNRPLFENPKGDLLTIEHLSDGEKQLYGRVIALMLLEPQNSVILIDEPEIALHPAWQQKIMQIYSRIGTNNQFIVATHSPQVIASVPYQNRIILRKEGGKIKPIHCHQPPSGVDVNSILSEVMGAEPISSSVLKLYQKYRVLVEAGNENSDEARSVRKELLEYEGEHSAFMQEMNFLIELRDAA